MKLISEVRSFSRAIISNNGIDDVYFVIVLISKYLINKYLINNLNNFEYKMSSLKK